MKKTLNFCFLICLLGLGITFSGCEKDLYEDAIKGNTVVENSLKEKYHGKYIEGETASGIAKVLSKKIENARFANRGLLTNEYGTILYDKILLVEDELGNKTYTFKVEHPDANPSKFFNMVMQEKIDGSSLIKFFEYQMSQVFAEKYNLGLKDIKDFEGNYNYKLVAYLPEVRDTEGNTGDENSGGNNSGGNDDTTPFGGNSTNGSTDPCIQGNGTIGDTNNDSGTDTDFGVTCSSSILHMAAFKYDFGGECWWSEDFDMIVTVCVSNDNRIANRTGEPCDENNNGIGILSPENAKALFLSYLMSASLSGHNLFISLDSSLTELVYNYAGQSQNNAGYIGSYFVTLINNNQFEWYSQQNLETQTNILNFAISNGFSQNSQVLTYQTINQIIQNPALIFDEIIVENIVNNLSNPITGDPIELYLLAQYKNSNTLNLSTFSVNSNSLNVGEYILIPHYNANGTLVFYIAVRYDLYNGGLLHDFEYIIKPNGLANFQQQINLYTAAANLFYMNGTPSQGQIAMMAGDYVTGLKDMWADALTNPQYYIYLAHIFVGCATNLAAVESTSPVFDGKIRFTSSTQGSSVQNITINNRSASQYKQLISQKFPNSSWNLSTDGQVENFISGNIKYTGRFENNSGFYYTIDYSRNGQVIGKFRFNN